MSVETEAKLRASARAFREIARDANRDGVLAGWRVAEQRRTHLRDTYWDTPDRQLGLAGCTLRVRELNGAAIGELTFKGTPSATGSVSRTRLELTAAAPAGSGPDQWQRLPSAGPVLEALSRVADLRYLRPDLVLLNPRHDLVLEHGSYRAVLSLDEMRIEGQPYFRRYVEIELEQGSPAALDALVRSVATRYRLRRALEGKVQAARRWMRTRALPPSTEDGPSSWNAELHDRARQPA